MFVKVRKTSSPTKDFKEIKVIKEKHQLKLPRKNRKKEN